MPSPAVAGLHHPLEPLEPIEGDKPDPTQFHTSRSVTPSAAADMLHLFSLDSKAVTQATKPKPRTMSNSSGRSGRFGISLLNGTQTPVEEPPLDPVPSQMVGDERKYAVEPAQDLAKMIEKSKQLAAWAAVDHYVLPEHKVIGIGSGSTVPYVVERIVAQGEEINRGRKFIPTSFQAKELIVSGGLVLGDVDQYPDIDVDIDGADEVDVNLNAIKGGGACHLREKVLAEAAEKFIIVADYRKNSAVLGTSWTQGIPIEVAPFAYAKVLGNLHKIPGCKNATLRMGKAKAGPVVTDNGCFCIDAQFDDEHYSNPEALLHKIKMLTGIVEVGLFCGMATAAYFGNADGSVTIRNDDGTIERLEASDIPTLEQVKEEALRASPPGAASPPAVVNGSD